MGRSGAQGTPYVEKEELQASQEMEAVLGVAFGRALESEAENELPDNADGRSTGRSRKCTRERNDQSFPISAIETRKAVCGVRSALQSVADLTRNVSHAI